VTLKRLADFHLIRGTGPSGNHFEVFVEVSPLTPRQLERLPEWTRATHERLFGAHLEGITRTDEHQARIATITARLDRLQQPAGRGPDQATGLQRAIGR
jgi:hypothetical protein